MKGKTRAAPQPSDAGGGAARSLSASPSAGRSKRKEKRQEKPQPEKKPSKEKPGKSKGLQVKQNRQGGAAMLQLQDSIRASQLD